MNKFYYALILLVVLAIALISRWLLTTIESPGSHIPAEARHDPDYFLENFKITVYQADGAPAYYLVAHYLNHYPDDDTLALQQLKINYTGKQEQTWVTTANTGTAYQNIEVMHLDGDVQIHRTGAQPADDMLVKTSSLRIDFPSKRATTEAEVKIIGKNSTIEAKGMEVDLAAGNLTLMSKARGHYAPN